jgi:ADP-heptose:LPS heptosyltransferase
MVKFLVVRFSSIGDIILTTPVIRGLKTQVEEAEVHYLTKKRFEPILSSNPYLDKIYSLDHNFGKLIQELKKEKYDYIIDLHRNIRTARLKISIPSISFSFKKLNILKWLLVNFKINKLPEIHIVDRYLKTVELFSVENDNKGLDYFIPAGEEISIPKTYGYNPGEYVVIVVGGGHYTKQIPEERLIELINHLRVNTILIGGPVDTIKAEKIVGQITQNQKVINQVGKLSINQSASVIRQSRLILTPDTGMMHIAAAFQKNIISVWGNTVPVFGMYPYLPGEQSEIFEVKKLSCRPCSKIGFKTCPKKHFNCMNQQDFKAIIRKIELI